MIFRRLGLGLVAVATVAACVGVVLLALVFALFSLAEARLGVAGASALVALISSAPLVVLALLLSRFASSARPLGFQRRRAPAPRLTDAVLSAVRHRPLVAMSIALGVGLIGVFNPRYVGAAARAFLDAPD